MTDLEKALSEGATPVEETDLQKALSEGAVPVGVPKDPQGLQRYLTLIQQGIGHGVSGTLGLPGDLSNWLRQKTGATEPSPLPTSEAIYEKLFAMPGYQVSPEGLGEKALQFGAGFIPDVATAGGAKLLRGATEAGPMLRKMGASLYRSGLKPSPFAGFETGQDVVQTLMKYKIPYNEAGVQKMEGIINNLGQAADDIIATVQKDIPVNDILKEVYQLKGRYKDLSATEYKPIAQFIDNFVTKNAASMGKAKDVEGITPFPGMLPEQVRTMTIQELQKFKKATYDYFAQAYNQARPPIESLANTTAARAAKEEIAKAAPDVVPINNELQGLLEARPFLDRAAGRAANYEPMGLNTGMWAAAGQTPGAAGLLGGANKLLGVPGVRSPLAFALDSLGKSEAYGLTKPLLLLQLLKGQHGAFGGYQQ